MGDDVHLYIWVLEQQVKKEELAIVAGTGDVLMARPAASPPTAPGWRYR